MLRYLILLIIIIIPSFWFLLTPNYYNMHDDLHPIRQLEMEKCFHDGQFPCRWVPDMGNGYGYPLFNYYPPLPYLVGQVFRLFGITFLWTFKLTAILQIIFSSLAIFFLSKKFFGPFGGLISGIFYAYAPYHAVNIFVRGALNEAWAGIFFPLIFLFIFELSQKISPKYSILLSLSVAGLLLSHNPMTIIFFPFVCFWTIFSLIYNKHLQFKYLITFCLSAVFSLSLSAFFILPSLLEIPLINTSSLFTDYYAYFVHFATIKQLLFSSFWGDGASTWGTNDQMSFSVGYLHWIIPLIITTIVSVNILIRKKISTLQLVFLFIFGLGIVSTFMTHQRSSFLWEIITPFQKIQFPWRFLNLSIFFLSFSIGYILLFLKNYLTTKILYLVPITVIFIVVLLNRSYFIPLHFGPITDSQKFTGSWKNFTTGSINDYLPITVKNIPVNPPSSIVDSIQPPNSVTISNQKHGTDWISFNASLDKPANLTLAQFYFPKFILSVDQVEHQINIDKQGLINLTLTPGNHQVYLKLYSTPLRTVSNLISFTAWFILLVILTTRLCWKIRSPSKT